jgi:GntR family transcriptional regulator / MocR family aminotransferase
VQSNEASWIALEREPGETLRAGLRRTLLAAIRSGALREGVRLPASRVLARQLGVSRGVVSDAYAQLEAEGFVVTRERAAPVVAPVPAQAPRRPSEPPGEPAPRYDLTPTTPDVLLFPLGPWLAAYQRAGRRAPAATLDYRDSRGEAALREVLADHLGRTRGVIADPAQVVVVQGTAQGVDLLLRTLRERGARRIAVEDPSHTMPHLRIRALGFELVAQPVDREGVVAEGLRADAVLVTPAHQFPTGCVLGGQRRRELLAWAERTDGLLIEDDYDSEFRYDREPVRALQGLAPGCVAYVGTVSKTLAPALRLGWVIAPFEVAEQLRQAKRLADDFSPALDQLALAALIADGAYDRHLGRARRAYRARRDALIGALAKQLPELDAEGVAAGVHLLLRLPGGVSDAAVAEDAARAGVRVPPLSAFRITPSDEGGLVVGYGRLHEAAVEPAARALSAVIREHI